MTVQLSIDLRSDELRDALNNRAQRLERRIMELGLGANGVAWPEGTAAESARYYLRNLIMEDAEVAQEVLRVLVDETEAYEDRFWGTHLGQTLFFLGAFPQERVSRRTAQAVLGLRNRQRVHQLITEGLLDEDMGGLISVESVRSLIERAR